MRLSERLHQTLLIVAEETVQYSNGWPKPEFLRTSRGKEIRRMFENHLREILCIRDMAEHLAEGVQQYAEIYGPRATYEARVLEIWTRLGGQLRFSRHPKTGRPQGPLVRFFRAVTTPVMGASAPSLQSLPNIIRRQQKRILGNLPLRKKLMGIHDRGPLANLH